MGRPLNEKAAELMNIYPRLKTLGKKDREIAKEWGITFEALRYAKRQAGYDYTGWLRDVDRLIE